MSDETRIDASGVRRVGGVFSETARAVDVAIAGVGECDFGSGLGQRYDHHAVDYAAGLLAIAQSVRLLALQSRRFGEGLVSSADTLEAHDGSNAEAIADVDLGRG